MAHSQEIAVLFYTETGMSGSLVAETDVDAHGIAE